MALLRTGRNERYKITFSQEHAKKSGCSQSKILSVSTTNRPRVYLRARDLFLERGLCGGGHDAKRASELHENTSEDPISHQHDAEGV